MALKTLDDIDLAGKIVLIRVDLNVPVEDGRVTDRTRLARLRPTVSDIIGKGGKPVLLAHFGRPEGKRVPEMSLAVVREALADVLGVPVTFHPDCVGGEARAAIDAMTGGEVVLLENVRFHRGEKANDDGFADDLARMGDVYVNDAFSASHRAHASTAGLARRLPAVAGRLMQAELAALETALGTPERPVVAVVGGAKVSTKLDLLGNLLRKVDYLVIGGGMANTFLKAEGVSVGTSLVERDMVATAREIMEEAGEAACEIVLPVDVVVAKEFKAGADSQIVTADGCPDDMMILDVGPKSIEKINTVFESARTLVWNGPLGAFEIPPFDAATLIAAQKAAELTRAGRLVSVAGGGDTVSALNRAGVAGEFTYVSGGGGAFLEWMEGRPLPGIAALAPEAGLAG